MLSKGVLLLVVFTAAAIAVPDSFDEAYDIQSDEPAPTITQCATTCPASTSSSKFGYETGKTYEYVYESDIKTTVPGRMAEHSSLHMRSTVQIEVVSTCEMVLRLSEVSLQDSNPTNIESRQHVANAVAFKTGLQSKTLAFAFIDGQIDSICPDTADETWAVNIKRGVLSAFQNTMTTLSGASNAREMDVSGACPVRYDQMTGGWGTRKVKKTKDLLACTDRQSGQTVFQAVQYDAASDIQSMPLMKSSHSCEQEINNRERIISKTSCNEVHVFRPFARDDSGATTEVTYKLEFTRKTDGVSNQAAISRTRSNLLYDHRLSEEEMAANVREAKTSLTNLCSKTEVDVRPDAPGLFNRLVKQMRKLDASNLKRLQSVLKTGMCQKADQYFRDALPVLGTTGGVVVMRDLITEGKANDVEAERWLTSIAFISNPTPDMIKELQPLLRSDFERSALPVSSLINTYCQLYNDQDSAEVQDMLKTMETELSYNCKYETEAQRSRMLKALKAIGNAGNAERIVPTLNRCIANNEVPIALRVAAISAFRRISCSAERTDLITLMENKQADAELRIMSYLAAMQCANADVIGRVRTMLESDEVNQVGSFIWTHLTNLQETSCPMKSDIQDLLKDVVLSKTYDLDKRKFSRNIELSGFSEVFNMGAVLESNLIWSAQSYVPRSAMVNLTVDVFGQSINFVEVGGRAQGLESLLEKFFGPGSDNSIRQKRAVVRDEVLNIIDTKYPKMRDDLSLSYYMRVFGNEIRTGEINDFDFEGMKNRYNFLDWMIKLAQDNRIDVTRNFLFLDSTFTVPTGVGMPLRLGVEGTATIAFTASGKVDVLRMLSSPSNFDINGSIRPSAAIEIRGEMGVCAHFARTGLKTVNLLHTSRILDGKIQLQDGKIFNVDLNLPQEKVEIFTAESHFYVTYRDQDREQTALRPDGFEKKECTGPKVTYIFGVEVCGEVSLKGPFVAKAYVNKQDTHTGYHFEAGYRQSEAEMTESVRVSLNTPGSRIDREITADFKLDRINGQVEMKLKSPWKKVSAEGALVNSAALKRATMKATIDDTIEYSVTAEVQIDDKRAEVRYTPNIKVTYPDPRTQQQAEVVFDGSVVYTRGKKVVTNLALRNAFQQPITFDGTVTLTDKKQASKYDTDIKFSSPFVKAGLTGFVSNSQESGNTWSSRADLSYQIVGERTKERIVINHKFRDQSTSNLRSYSTDFSWTSVLRPRYNGQVGLELAFSPNSLKTKVEVGIDNIKKVTFVQSGAFDFSGADKKINGVVKFELPYKNWDYELKVDHIHNLETLQSNGTLKYGDSKQMSLDVGLKKENTRFLNMQGEAIFRMPEVEMSFIQSLTERAPREYHGQLSVQGIPRIQSARVTSVYKMVPRHEFSADVTVNGWEPLSIKTHLNPNLKNLESRAEVTYGTRNYMADVNWLHRGTGAAFNTRANAEVAYTGKTHGVTAEVSRRNQEFTTSIEVKIAENKKVSLSTQVTAIKTEPKVQARLEWPDNFMALTASGKYETKGWLTTTNDLEGSIEFTSSVPRLEKLGASFRHDQAAKSMKTIGEMSWATDKKITGDFSYDKNKISLDLTTPFVGYQVIKAEDAYTPKGKLYGHTTKLSWDTNQMVLTITGEFNKPSLSGRVTFTSPFQGFESLSSSLKHAVTGDSYQTSADVTWARGQQITLAMNMNHNLNGWAMTNSGDLQVQTPFRGYRVAKLTWSHQNDASKWKCHHELEVSGQKYILDVDSAHKLTRVARQLTAKASFQSPIQGYENLRFSSEYQHDLRGVKSTGKSSVSWGQKSIELEHDVTYSPNAALLIKGQLATPFRGIETIGIDLNNRRSGNTFTAANELNIGRYGRSTLGGTMTYDGYSIDANLRLTTPYQYLERVATSLKNAKQQDVWVTHADFEYAPDKSYAVDTQVGWESQKKFEVEVKTPHSNMQSMKFKSGVTGTPRNFQVSSELEHNNLQEKITFALSADTANTRSMNTLVEIKTPFSSFSNFKATASHTKRNAQSCLTKLNYEFNSQRGSLNHESTVRSWVDFTTKSELEYITGRKIELATSLSIDPKIVGTATFRSPFTKARELGLTFNQEGPLDNFKTGLELSFSRREKINTNLEFTMNRDGTLRVFSSLTTPYQSVERAAMEINRSGSFDNFRGDASFELNSQKLAGNVQFQNDDQSGIKINGQLETPFDNLRQGSVALTHNGGWRSFSNNAEITYDGNTISTTSEFNVEGPTVKFTLRTPYRAVQNVIFNFANEYKNTRAGKGWSNNASLQVNNQRYTGESEYIWVGKQLKAKAVVKIPQEYSIVVQHRGDTLKDFTNSVVIKMDENTVTRSLSYKYTENLIDATATMESTFPRTPENNNKIEATFKHEGPVSDFTTRASITTSFPDFNELSTVLTYRGNPTDFTSSLTVNTPFRSYPRMTATVNHKFTGAALNSDLTITTTSDQQIVAAVSYKKDGTSIEAGASLKTPYNGYENFETNFLYNGNVRNFRSSASVTTPFQGYERFSAELNHAGPASRFKTSGKFECSTNSPLGFSIDHSFTDAWNLNTAVELTIPSGKIATTFTNSGESGSFRSGLKVTTPFRGYNKFEVKLEHDGGIDTPKSKVTVTTPFRGYNNFQLTSEKSGNLRNIQLKAELTTSIRNWERTAASWSHNFEVANSVQMNGQIETSFAGLDKITGSLSHTPSTDGFITTITLETPVQGYERQSITINHSNRRNANIKTTGTVETSVAGYSRFSGTFDYTNTRRLTKTSVSVETPIRGYDKFSTNVEWNGNDAKSFSGSVQVSTSIRGYERFSATLNHNGDAAQFETSTRVITPFSPQVDASIRHRGGLTDFTTGATVEYNSKKIETEVAFKRTASRYESNYVSSIKMTSPCPYVRDFNLVATHNRQTDVKTGSLDVTLNSEKKVDFDYRYTTADDQQITINIRNPYTMSTELNVGGSDGRAVVNWDTTRQDSQVQFDFGFKNIKTTDLTDRLIKFKTTVPRRTIGFELGYTLSADKFTNRGELQWDSDPESEFLYEIEGTKSSTRYVTAFDGTLKITSGLHTSTSSFSHKTNARRKYTTEVVIQSTERLRMSNEVTMTSGGFTHTFVVQHPRFTQDASITTEGTITGSSKGVKTTIKYERQTFTIEGQVTDESQYDSLRSSGTFRFAHPNSFTDVQVTGDVFNDDEKVGGNAEIQYQMTRERSMQKASLKTQVNKANKDFTLELASPVDTLRLTATNRFVDNSNGMYGYELSATTNQVNVKTVSELNLRDRSFDAKFYYTTADYLHLFAQALSPIQANFEMSHYVNSERTNDISASLALSDERLLTGRTFIRPGLREDVLELLRPDQLYPRDLAANTQQWATTMSDDFKLKSQRMKQAAIPFTNAASAIANDVNAKVDEVKAAFQVVYNRNEFYIRDMHLALKRAAEQITVAVQNKLDEMTRSLEIIANRAARYFAQYNRIWQQRMNEVNRRLAESWQTVANKFEEMRPNWDEAIRVLQTKIAELGSCIRNHPRVRAMIERLNALELSDFLPPSDWQQRLQATYDTHRRLVEEFMSRPELREVRDWLIKKVEETMWMYEYFGYRDQVNLWIEQLRALTWDAIKTKAIDGVKNYLQLSKNRWTTWDVSRGEYAFQLYVPFDAMDLSFLQRLNLQRYLDYIRNVIARLIPDEEWTLIDTVYSYWPSKDVYNWIPPFKSHASISGSQHFMTFDHKFYKFAGECSYLLTRDFVDKSFSVIVNYDRMVNNLPTRKSITVISDGKQIEVFPDAKVTVDGVRSEMPLRVANSTVKRTGNAISIESDRGFSVFCDLAHDTCSISVSGWYYNKMAGLLGTYDNEPSNDMTTIDNTVTDRPETLAYSWTVGQKCRPNNRAIEQRAEPDTKRYEVCAKYFKNSASPFRSCFRQVNPEPYIQMCINDLPSADEDLTNEEGVCKVAAAYVQECRRHNVHLRLPRMCVRCEVDSARTYYEAQTFEFTESTPAPKMADVVFIVQHAPCNKLLLDKVKGLVDDLDKSMIAEGLTNTRYAIVGFGGKDHLATPHIHTMDGQIFNSVNKISQGLNKFDLEAGQLPDPMAAIRYSAKMAFRAGASKTFILLPCDACTETSIRYRDLQRALLDSDVRLHVMVQSLIQLKSNAKANTAYIFGADMDTVYTRMDVASQDLYGEPDLLRYVRVPKDLCVALTQDTNGSYFSAKQWLDNSRPVIQKRFTDVMVRVIARKAQPTVCQNCECVADELGVGNSQCGSCEARYPVHGYYPDFTERNEVEEVAPAPAPSAPTTTMKNKTPTKAPRPVTTKRVTRPRQPRPTPRPRPTRRAPPPRRAPAPAAVRQPRA